MKKLKDIISCNYNIDINDIKTDSREVELGDLFVAVHGFNVDHSEYIDDAIKNGCSAVITDKNYISNNFPIIKVDDIDKTLVDVCKKNYDYNEKNVVIGVTGTDGKTTTATLIKKIMNNYINTAYIGTNGIEVANTTLNTDNTTPTTEKLYKYLKFINNKNTYDIAMEVSSEALLHKRVDGLKYKYAVFTNIKEDHLNIHKTVDNYIESKFKLTELVDKDGCVIINNDDSVLNKLKSRIAKNVITYGKSKNSDFIIENIHVNDDATIFTLKHNNDSYHITTQLIGEYNIYNLAAAFIVCYLEGMNTNDIVSSIKKIKSINGRGEIIDFGQDYTIILDYAHTENAIKSIVETFRGRNITVVTGAAGGREKEKRHRIGKYLLENVNKVIFTMDDPRYEKVDDIIDDMISTSSKKNYKRIINRSEAIKYALDNAKKDDVVLILGKGRDNYMAIEDRKEYYSDYDEIEKYFKK